MTDIRSIDSATREHTLSVLECLATKPDTAGVPKPTQFNWVTDCRITVHTGTTLANAGGRIRGKVEHEGFTVQKHGGFGLEHAYRNNPPAAKVFSWL
ncbi:MAG: hypothetical protein HYZ72_02110 [Deltaproteobacteria bacterium]|nr:hypothetical protein [Deltaproteobacteria bacterium]